MIVLHMSIGDILFFGFVGALLLTLTIATVVMNLRDAARRRAARRPK